MDSAAARNILVGCFYPGIMDIRWGRREKLSGTYRCARTDKKV